MPCALCPVMSARLPPFPRSDLHYLNLGRGCGWSSLLRMRNRGSLVFDSTLDCDRPFGVRSVSHFPALRR